MDARIKTYNQAAAFGVFIALPVLLYFFGDFPRRTVLKEVISLLTIIAFFTMLMQFYLSRANRNSLRGHKMSKVLKWHKALGYIFVGLLIFHPVLIIVPRFFEAGIDPQDAFLELISNFGKKGLLLGLIAWSVMIIIGVTSFFRDKLPFSYRTWRVFHGILSIVFVGAASFHVTDLGRHMNKPMTWLVAILAVTAVALLLKTYSFKPVKNNKK